LISSHEVNRVYLELCVKIEEILSQKDFSILSSQEWRPVQNLLGIDDMDYPEGVWELGGIQLVGEFQSNLEELYIKNGSKQFPLDNSEIEFIEKISKFLEDYQQQKKKEPAIMEKTLAKMDISKSANTTSNTNSAKLRVMAFIDGGFLEYNLRAQWGEDVTINFARFRESLMAHLGSDRDTFHLIHIYYYDAKLEEEYPTNNYAKPDPQKVKDWNLKMAPRIKAQNLKHQTINRTDYFVLRLGRIKRNIKLEPKQKGVDTLLATDMVSKAFQNQYDIAVLLTGDDDFIDVVKTVRELGKQVFGLYFESVTSQGLIDALTTRLAIDTNFATQIRVPQRPIRIADKTTCDLI
jgi:uncharacterized LabA/DUF88 family protein